MPSLVETYDDDETPTRKEATSGKWIIAVDRGARLIADAISTLENGGDVQAAIDDLKTAHSLVMRGGAS